MTFDIFLNSDTLSYYTYFMAITCPLLMLVV